MSNEKIKPLRATAITLTYRQVDRLNTVFASAMGMACPPKIAFWMAVTANQLYKTADEINKKCDELQLENGVVIEDGKVDTSTEAYKTFSTQLSEYLDSNSGQFDIVKISEKKFEGMTLTPNVAAALLPVIYLLDC